jgi:putative membrane protein
VEEPAREHVREEAEDDAVARRPDQALAPPDGPGRLLVVAVVGFGMGIADVVPGFSGGTVALLTGVYERLVANVRQGARALALLLRLRVRAGLRSLGAVEWSFLLPLLAGIVLAVVLLAGVLTRLLESHPRELSAVFLGLVLGATVVAAGDLRHRRVRDGIVGLLVTAVTFAGLGFTGGAVDDPALLAYFAAGAVGVCAMILPGVSGAFLLLLLGMYYNVVTAVDERDLLVIGVVAVGCMVGLAGFSTLLNWLLREHHDLVLAALLGLMVGSSRVLWPWPGTEVGDPRLGGPVVSDLPLVPLLALGAFAAVIVLGRSARRATRA